MPAPASVNEAESSSHFQPSSATGSLPWLYNSKKSAGPALELTSEMITVCGPATVPLLRVKVSALSEARPGKALPAVSVIAPAGTSTA